MILRLKTLPIMLLCTSSLLVHANPSNAPSNSSSETLSTTVRLVPVVDEKELPDSVQQVPQLVEKIQVEQVAANNPYVLLPHRPNFIMPVTYRTNNDMPFITPTGQPIDQGDGYDHVEIVFQLSVKYRMAQGWLGKMSFIDFGYTNRSFWQAYNKDGSSPFRETNHEPEIIFGWQTNLSWLNYVGFAVNHQSNGQAGELSRSWNRIILSGTSVLPSGVLHAKAWWRLPEDAKETPTSARGDDNPDIQRYVGIGELMYLHMLGEHNVALTVRNNFEMNNNRGSLMLEWTFPLSDRVKGYVQMFDGYGDSLIEYDRRQRRIGIGFKLSDWI